MWNKNVCLTNKKTIFVIVIGLVCTLALASVWTSEEPIPVMEPPVEQVKEIDSCEIWVPTKEDIEYQDSMYTIIQNTQRDVDTIKVQVQQIIKRLDDVQ